MISVWQAIEQALSEHAPTVIPTLNPPATDGQLSRLETMVGASLPSDVRDYLRIHNGQYDPSRLETLCAEGTLLDVDAILSTWRMLNEIDGEGPPPADRSWVWSDRNYLPLTDADGDHLSVDLTTGEIVMHVHDGTIEPNIAPDFMSWLEVKLKILQKRRFTKEDGILLFEAQDS